MGFYSRYGRRGYGRFGDVAEAQDAVAAAQAKVASITVERANQVKLIAFTKTALNKCSDFSAAALFTAGASVAVCVAEQQTALGQREGQLAQIDLRLSTAKGELAAAQQALMAARNQAASMPSDVVVDTYGVGVPSTVGYSSGAMTGSGGGGLMDMLSNPLVIGGGVAVLALGAYLAFGKKG